MHVAVTPQLIVVANLVALVLGVGRAFFVVVDDMAWLGHFLIPRPPYDIQYYYDRHTDALDEMPNGFRGPDGGAGWHIEWLAHVAVGRLSSVERFSLKIS